MMVSGSGTLGELTKKTRRIDWMLRYALQGIDCFVLHRLEILCLDTKIF
jgi:hypothetical protein